MTRRPALIGHARMVAAFEEARGGGRLHHGWLLSGPRGVGKARFAALAARALIAGTPFETIDAGAARRIAEGNDPLASVLRCGINEKTGKPRTQITVEQVRAARGALTLAADRDAWRCVIVDAAEDMNVAAANALLKVLEEPPARVTFFLVSHAPGRLLPTIRSRCRQLDFRPLAPEEMREAARLLEHGDADDRLIEAAQGSPGRLRDLCSGDGPQILAAVDGVLAPLPAHIDRVGLHALADLIGTDSGGFAMAAGQASGIAARLTLFAAGVEEPPAAQAALAGRIGPNARNAAAWSETVAEIEAERRRAGRLNLDPRQSILDMFVRIEETARRTSS